MKRCLLNEIVPIDRKCAYWIKICLLKGYNPLNINSGSYSFDNLFSTSFLSLVHKKCIKCLEIGDDINNILYVACQFKSISYDRTEIKMI